MLNFYNQQCGDIILVDSQGLLSKPNKFAQQVGSLASAKYTHALMALDFGGFIESIADPRGASDGVAGVRILSGRELNDRYESGQCSNFTVLRINGHQNYQERLMESARFQYGKKYVSDMRKFVGQLGSIDDEAYCSQLIYEIYKDVGIDIRNSVNKKGYKGTVVWPVHLQNLDRKQWNDVTSMYLPSKLPSNENLVSTIDFSFKKLRLDFNSVLEHGEFLDSAIRETLSELDNAEYISATQLAKLEDHYDRDFNYPTFYENFCSPLEIAIRRYESTLEANDTLLRPSFKLKASYKIPEIKIISHVLICRLHRHMNRPRTILPRTMDEHDFNKSRDSISKMYESTNCRELTLLIDSVLSLWKTYQLLHLQNELTQQV